MNFLNKTALNTMNALKSKKGASNIEIIVWISVVLVIATVLFLFRDAITTFVTNAIAKVGAFSLN